MSIRQDLMNKFDLNRIEADNLVKSYIKIHKRNPSSEQIIDDIEQICSRILLGIHKYNEENQLVQVRKTWDTEAILEGFIDASNKGNVKYYRGLFFNYANYTPYVKNGRQCEGDILFLDISNKIFKKIFYSDMDALKNSKYFENCLEIANVISVDKELTDWTVLEYIIENGTLTDFTNVVCEYCKLSEAVCNKLYCKLSEIIDERGNLNFQAHQYRFTDVTHNYISADNDMYALNFIKSLKNISKTHPMKYRQKILDYFLDSLDAAKDPKKNPEIPMIENFLYIPGVFELSEKKFNELFDEYTKLEPLERFKFTYDNINTNRKGALNDFFDKFIAYTKSDMDIRDIDIEEFSKKLNKLRKSVFIKPYNIQSMHLSNPWSGDVELYCNISPKNHTIHNEEVIKLDRFEELIEKINLVEKKKAQKILNEVIANKSGETKGIFRDSYDDLLDAKNPDLAKRRSAVVFKINKDFKVDFKIIHNKVSEKNWKIIEDYIYPTKLQIDEFNRRKHDFEVKYENKKYNFKINDVNYYFYKALYKNNEKIFVLENEKNEMLVFRENSDIIDSINMDNILDFISNNQNRVEYFLNKLNGSEETLSYYMKHLLDLPTEIEFKEQNMNKLKENLKFLVSIYDCKDSEKDILNKLIEKDPTSFMSELYMKNEDLARKFNKLKNELDSINEPSKNEISEHIK